MIIGITQRVIENSNGTRCDALEQDYIKFFSSFKVDVIPIPNNLKNIEKFINTTKIDRIILSGGGDINPELYGQKAFPGQFLMPDRDNTELKLLKHSIKNKIPVLGICRGMQMINIFFGGTLSKIIKNNPTHVNVTHAIDIIDDKFKKILGDKFSVNSFHNFTIKKSDIGFKLKPFAETAENMIEGFYIPNQPIYGIMWHPERNQSDTNKFDRKLINLFIHEKTN